MSPEIYVGRITSGFRIGAVFEYERWLAIVNVDPEQGPGAAIVLVLWLGWFVVRAGASWPR